MAFYVNPKAYYKSIWMPIESYIHFRKWYGLGQIAGGTEEDLARLKELKRVFDKGGDEEKATMQQRNIVACEHLIKTKVNPYELAFMTLLKGNEAEDFEEKALKEKLQLFKKHWIKEPDLKRVVTDVAFNVGQQLVFYNLEKGDWVQDRFRTIYERDHFRVIRNAVVKAYEELTADVPKLYKNLVKIYKVQDGQKQERSIPATMFKNLVVLRQAGYKVVTAHDYYLAVQLQQKVVDQVNEMR